MNRPGEVNLRVVFEEEESPSFEALEMFVDGLKPILNGYSKAFMGEELEWSISDLKLRSIGIGVFPSQARSPHLEDPLKNMSRRLVRDLAGLENGASPDLTILGPDNRAWTKWIQLLTSNKVAKIEVETDGASTVLTPTGVGAIEPPRPLGAVVDSVRGIIQGVNFSNGTYFTLHRDSDNHPIRCHFKESMEEQVKAALRKRVSVTGKVKRDAAGEYQSIAVTLPPRVLASTVDRPRIADLVGIAPDLVVSELLSGPIRERRRAP